VRGRGGVRAEWPRPPCARLRSAGLGGEWRAGRWPAAPGHPPSPWMPGAQAECSSRLWCKTSALGQHRPVNSHNFLFLRLPGTGANSRSPRVTRAAGSARPRTGSLDSWLWCFIPQRGGTVSLRPTGHKSVTNYRSSMHASDDH
jgi:hypothetical protein